MASGVLLDSQIIIGSLPKDLCEAARSIKIHCDRHFSDSFPFMSIKPSLELVFSDEHEQYKWRVKAEPYPNEITRVLIDGAECKVSNVYRLRGSSWRREHRLSSIECSVSTSVPEDTTAFLKSVDTTSHTLCTEVVYTLAKKPLLFSEVLHFLGHDKYETAHVQQCVEIVSLRTGNGLLELKPLSYLLLNIEQFENDKDKQEIANSAYSSLKKMGYDDMAERFLPFVDRDIILKSGGGIMKGLGALGGARKRLRSSSVADESKNRSGAAPLAMYHDMDECPFSWREGDLSQYLNSREIEEMLLDCISARNKFLRCLSFADENVIDEQKHFMKEKYSTLKTEYESVLSKLQSHAELTVKAKEWRTTYGIPARCSEGLNSKLNLWWSKQLTPRQSLEELLRRVHGELFQAERDIVEHNFKSCLPAAGS